MAVPFGPKENEWAWELKIVFRNKCAGQLKGLKAVLSLFCKHCSFNRVIRHRTFVPGAIFADFSMARQAGLRVTGYGSTNATSRIACSLLEPSHTRTASPSGEVFSRRFSAPAMRLMSQRRGKPFRFMTCKETMSWLVVIRT